MGKISPVCNKKNNSKKSSSKKNQETLASKASNEAKNPFDFGGLPIRDFKKNLGCG